MSEIKVQTVFGEAVIKDVMIEGESKCLVEGVDIKLEGEFICELRGFCAESFEDDAELVEHYIEENV